MGFNNKQTVSSKKLHSSRHLKAIKKKHCSGCESGKSSAAIQLVSKAEDKSSNQDYMEGKIISHVVAPNYVVDYIVYWTGNGKPFYTVETQRTLSKCPFVIGHYKKNRDGDFQFIKKLKLQSAKTTALVSNKLDIAQNKPVMVQNESIMPPKHEITAAKESIMTQKEPCRIIDPIKLNGERYFVVHWSSLRGKIMSAKQVYAKWPHLLSPFYKTWAMGLTDKPE